MRKNNLNVAKSICVIMSLLIIFTIYFIRNIFSSNFTIITILIIVEVILIFMCFYYILLFFVNYNNSIKIKVSTLEQKRNIKLKISEIESVDDQLSQSRMLYHDLGKHIMILKELKNENNKEFNDYKENIIQKYGSYIDD